MAEQAGTIQKQQVRRITEAEQTRDRRLFVPRTDIYETEDAVVVVAEMPGVDNESVDINVEHNELRINGRVKQPSVEGHRLTLAEYEVGDYQRTFRLSDDVDVDKIDASMKNGVLTIVLPKSEQLKPKKITVKAG